VSKVRGFRAIVCPKTDSNEKFEAPCDSILGNPCCIFCLRGLWFLVSSWHFCPKQILRQHKLFGSEYKTFFSH